MKVMSIKDLALYKKYHANISSNRERANGPPNIFKKKFILLFSYTKNDFLINYT